MRVTVSEFEDLSNKVDDILEDYSNREEATPEEVNLIEDSVSFTKALWDLLKTNGLNHPSDIPDIQVMEQAIDRMYGELAAACMMFTDSAYNKLPLLFYGTHKKLKAANHPDVPSQMVQGFHDFGVRLENTQKTKQAFMDQEEVKEM